jgi:hypothetical protein
MTDAAENFLYSLSLKRLIGTILAHKIRRHKTSFFLLYEVLIFMGPLLQAGIFFVPRTPVSPLDFDQRGSNFPA